MRAQGQVRAVPGAVIGFDMTAVLALARAAGMNEALVVEFLPPIEAEFVAAANRKDDSINPEDMPGHGDKAGSGQDSS